MGVQAPLAQSILWFFLSRPWLQTKPKVTEEERGRAGQSPCSAPEWRAEPSPDTVVRVAGVTTLSGRRGRVSPSE